MQYIFDIKFSFLWEKYQKNYYILFNATPDQQNFKIKKELNSFRYAGFDYALSAEPNS